MADKSAIEWTDATWNPIVGCSIVSPGCTRCYAMKMAGRIEAMGGAKHYAGTTRKVNGNAVWTGKVAMAPEHILLQPLAWRGPRRIFVNSMGDLFHEDVPDEWIDRVFAVMALCSQHTFQILTKRGKRMRQYFEKIDAELRAAGEQGYAPRRLDQLACDLTRSPCAAGRMEETDWPLPNVWLGVSAERQQEADERVPELLATPAAIRFVSAEPLLGPIDFTGICTGWYFIDAVAGRKYHDAPEGVRGTTEECARLDWVIVGGESGTDARPMKPTWAQSIRVQCAVAGVPFFFKQWGANPILLVTNAGTGETPVPAEALLKPGDILNIHNSEDASERPAKVVAVVPVGVSVEYAIADQTGTPRPLMITKPRHREPLYILEWEGKQFTVLHAKIRKGLERAKNAGLDK